MSNQKLIYEYDFGDGWEHEILLEKVLTPDPAVRYPRCLGGEFDPEEFDLEDFDNALRYLVEAPDD